MNTNELEEFAQLLRVSVLAMRSLLDRQQMRETVLEDGLEKLLEIASTIESLSKKVGFRDAV